MQEEQERRRLEEKRKKRSLFTLFFTLNGKVSLGVLYAGKSSGIAMVTLPRTPLLRVAVMKRK